MHNSKDRLSGLHKSTISFCSFMVISVAFLIFALMFWVRSNFLQFDVSKMPDLTSTKYELLTMQ